MCALGLSAPTATQIFKGADDVGRYDYEDGQSDGVS